MSSLSPLSTSTLQNTINTSQQQINDILKTLSTGLAINSAGDDPANLAISDKLNSQALDAASTSTNAQNGLTYLQIAQQAYSNIINELGKIKDIANSALSTTYSDAQLETLQDSISESVNKIKDIEQNTMFNGVQVFNNNNSAGLVNEHMFAITSKTSVTVTTVTVDSNRGTDYSSYLTNTLNKYVKQPDGTLVNGVDANLTPGANVITIETADQLVAALDNQSSAGKTYVLLENIDLSSLGVKNTALLRGSFQGTLLGNGYAITGLNSSSSTANNVGLFENLGANAKIKDLTLADFNIKGNSNVGVLAGSATAGALVDNTAVLTSNVQANLYGGGLIGVSSATITHSYASGAVSGDTLSHDIGGLVGSQVGGSISESFSSSDVAGGSKIGGLAGSATTGAAISASYARGNVSGNTDIGGLVGNSGGAIITNTYALGEVSGQDNTAGLVGNNSNAFSMIQNSYSLSKVTDTTAAYNAADFTIASTGETAQGIAARPNDTYNLVYDYSGKTYAFSSVEDFNTLKDSNGTIGQFYELTDAVNNIWSGRTQQANPVTYTSSSLGTSVASLPNSTYGDFQTTDVTGTHAFASAEDLAKYNNGTPNGAISLYYDYNSGTKMWDAKKSTLNAGSGDYNYTMTAQGTNVVSTVTDPGDDYNIIKTVVGANAGTYAFATATDANNFNDGVTFKGTIGNFYKKNVSDTWDSFNLTSSTVTAPTTYGVSTLSTGIANLPNDDAYKFTTVGADSKKYAFSSAADMAKFGNGSNISGTIGNFYRLESDGNWDLVHTTQSAATTALTSQGTSTDNTVGYYSTYTFQKTLASGLIYAFANAGDLAKLNDDGTFSSSVGLYYTNNQNNNPSVSNQWTPMNATTANNVTEWDWSRTPDVSIGKFYGTTSLGTSVTTLPNSGSGTFDVLSGPYAFSSVTDRDNFLNGTGAVGLFYQDWGNGLWGAYNTSIMAGSGDYNYAMTAQGSNLASTATDPTVDYSIVTDISGKTLAFSNVTDQNNYNNGSTFLGNIGKYYEKQVDNTWKAYSVTSTVTGGVTTYTQNNTGNTNGYINDSGTNYSISGNFAFRDGSGDAAIFNNGSPTAALAKYFEKQADGTWASMQVTGTTQTSYMAIHATGTHADDVVSADGIDYIVDTTGNFAFKDASDASAYNNGNPWGPIDKYFEKQGGVWKAYQIDQSGGNFINNTAQTYGESYSQNFWGDLYPTHQYQSYDGKWFADVNAKNAWDNGMEFEGANGQFVEYNDSTSKYEDGDAQSNYTPTVQTKNVSYTGTTTVAASHINDAAYGFVTPLIVGGIAGTYAFQSSGDKDIFNSGNPNAPVDYYKFNTTTQKWDKFEAVKYDINTTGLTATNKVGYSGYDSNHLITSAADFVSKISADMAGNFLILNDIDLSSLGTLTKSVITGTFSGNLDGNGHTISNMTISATAAQLGTSDRSGLGLFQAIGSGSQNSIKNLNITNSSITVTGARKLGGSESYTMGAGLLAGWTSGANTTIENVSTSGTINIGYGSYVDSGYTYQQSMVSSVGGVVGSYQGTMKNVSSSATITGGSYGTGGLIGYGYDMNIQKSTFTGTVTGHGTNTGGLIGGAYDADISESSSTGTINAQYDLLWLRNNTTMVTTYWNSDISIGGLIGRNGIIGDGSIVNSFSSSNITTLNYSTSQVVNIGGLTGKWEDALADGPRIIQNSYASGTISHDLDDVEHIGGLVGSTTNSYGHGGTVTGSFYTVTGSGVSAGFAHATGATPWQPAVSTTPNTSGWDSNIWNQSGGTSTLKNDGTYAATPQTSVNMANDAAVKYSDGTYSFKSDADRTNFNSGSPINTINSYYKYNSGSGIWDEYHVTVGAGVIVPAGFSTSALGGANVKSNLGVAGAPIGGYNTALNYGGADYLFANGTDLSSFNNNSPNGTIANYYKYNTSLGKWDSFSVTSNTTPSTTTYNKNDLGSTVASRVNEPNYDYTYALASDKRSITAGTYSFNSLADKNDFIAITSGSLASYGDIYTYKYNGNTWDLEKIHGTITPDSYEENWTGTGVAGRPNQSGYTTMSADNQYAFANATDKANFNNGSYTGTIGTYYKYNSGTNKWDASKINEINPPNALVQSAVDSNQWVQNGTQKALLDNYLNGGTTTSPWNFTTYRHDANGNWYSYNLASTSSVETDYTSTVAGANVLVDEFTANSKMDSPSGGGYDVKWTDGDGEIWAFANTVDRDNFANGTGDVANLYNFRELTGKWEKYSFNYTAGSYNTTLTTANSKYSAPNDANYNNTPDSYSGTNYSFANSTDRDKVFAYFDGTLTGAANVEFYEQAGTGQNITWTRKNLVSTPGATTTVYTQNAGATGLISKPNDPNYDYSYVNAGGTLAAGTYSFNTLESKNNFISINAGSKAGFADIFAYKYNTGTKIWDMEKIAGTQTANSYSTSSQGSASVYGRPDKEGYDIFSADKQYAFASAADLTNFNNGTYTGAIANYYQYNSASNTWDAKNVTKDATTYAVTALGGSLTGKAQRPNVDGYTYLQTIAAGGKAGAGTYAFDSVEDRQSFIDFNAGAPTAKPVDNYYKMSAGTVADPITGKLVNQWSGQSLEYINNVGFLVGKNSGSIVNSAFGTGNASESYIGDDGVTMLGNSQLSSSASSPLNTWSGAVWDFTGSKPILKGTKSEGSEDILASSLPQLANENEYSYSSYDDYNTTASRLNVALNSYTNTLAAPAKDGTVQFATNKLISEMTVSNSADTNEIFTEGEDFVTYTNDNGATWKMDILSDAMAGKSIKIDYKGVATGATNQGTSGFSMYMGNNQNLNIKDMVIDLAGRLNFNITKEGGARSLLDSANSTLDYMNAKDTQLDGTISLATAALSNKTDKNTALNVGVKAFTGIDQAKQVALLLKEQLRLQTASNALSQFYSSQLSMANSMMNPSSSIYSYGFNNNNNYNTNVNGLYTGLTGVHYNTSAINDYNYKNTYGSDANK